MSSDRQEENLRLLQKNRTIADWIFWTVWELAGKDPGRIVCVSGFVIVFLATPMLAAAYEE